VVTLKDPGVVRYLSDNFVIAWSNLLPELYGNADPSAPPPASYDARAIATTPEGAGGGNIRAYFCRPDGKILHLSVGYWKPERFLAEARFARGLAGDGKGLAAAQRERRKGLQSDLDAARAAVSGSPAERRLRVAQAALRLRAAAELTPDLLSEIVTVLDRRREEVYTKGAVG
jgi:hypothetical protein